MWRAVFRVENGTRALNRGAGLRPVWENRTARRQLIRWCTIIALVCLKTTFCDRRDSLAGIGVGFGLETARRSQFELTTALQCNNEGCSYDSFE